MELIIGLVLGAFWTFIYVRYIGKNNKKGSKKDAVILIEKIKSVCKLITVEGEFAEIYHYQDTKDHFLKLITSKKKALILVNAKALIGFDLSKIHLESNSKNKTISLTHFPQPTVLSVESNLSYYDKSDGLFNKFAAEDLTDLNKAATKFIHQKIPKSGLLENAKKEALESILMIEGIVQTIGWKLDYSTLEIKETTKKTLDN